jgi:glycosyltransferase involved in cell wall biosynthesis
MIPWIVRKPVRRLRNALAAGEATLRQRERWSGIAATPARTGEVAVSYGLDRMPGPDDVVIGGAVKFLELDEHLPNAQRDFNLLYLGSSSVPIEARKLVRLARTRGAAFVWNQNGVAYPGWYGPGWELVNGPRARFLRQADHVFYQSSFCKLSADRFYGEPSGGWEILHNSVDTRRFVPESPPPRPLTILLGGSQYQRYRVVIALETLAIVRRLLPDARLRIAGGVTYSTEGEAEARQAANRLGVAAAVEFIGPYRREDAPALMRTADVLLHPKYNDPCPTVVLEAMSSGLPVVYSASGGTPELVGEEGGIGVPAPLDWQKDHPPSPQQLAEAILAVSDRIDELGEAARTRAVEQFDVRNWVERHRAVFERLVLA